jgi:hypothetical protein
MRINVVQQLIDRLADLGVTGRLPEPPHPIGLRSAPVVVFGVKDIDSDVIPKELAKGTVRKVQQITVSHLK